MRKADPLPLDMPQPDNIVQAWVDSRTGQGSDANCPGAVQMPYIRSNEPLRVPLAVAKALLTAKR